VVVFAYRKKWPDAAGLAVSVFGSAGVLFALKELIGRPRPLGPIPAYIETSFSFPSGHATLSIAFFAFLLWTVYGSMSPLWKRSGLISASIIILAIGFSRLYLGVHYLSDVLAGYILGGVFMALGIATVRKLRGRATSA
jgi:membrane-associated phospholipid phosphatase